MNLLRSLNISLSTTIIATILLVMLWWLPWLLGIYPSNEATITILESITLFKISGIWVIFAAFIVDFLVIFISYRILLFYLNVLSYLQFTLMVLFVTAIAVTQQFSNYSIATILVQVAVWQIYLANTLKINSKLIFNTFLSLCAASCFAYEYIYLIPVFAFGFIYFLEINFRNLFAIIFSLLFPILVFAGICYINNSLQIFYDYFTNVFSIEFNTNLFIENIEAIDKSVIVIQIVTLISIFLFWQNTQTIKYKMKKILYFFVTLWLVINLLTFFSKYSAMAFMLLNIIISAFLTTLNLVNYKNKTNQILMIAIIALLSVIYIFEILFNLI